MKKICLIFSLFFLTSCGGALESSWNNFTAYYNTFYNAKNDFNEGVNKVESQPIQLNPDRIVRAHPAPVNAGDAEFTEAISNGALVLRRHSDSKWTDNALLLIGKSYYYRQEFFLAIQTFERLIDLGTSKRLRQEAVLWKGRALLDIESYVEGVRFLESALADLKGRWDFSLEAEVRVLLGEHLALLENWARAAEVLEPATLRLKDSPLKGRSYFLLGQVLERQGELTRAFQAYSNVNKYYPAYEYIYWADLKRGGVARTNGNPELAESIYQSMLNDDKNFDRRNNILFELAQTYEQQGQPGQAEALYKQILNNPVSRQSNLLANTYYRLGQLYSQTYEDYPLAAAYFDSSSTLISDAQNKADDSFTLATAYGEYVALKNEISRRDSLLQLGALDQQARDSVIADIRRQKQALLAKNQANSTQSGNTLTNQGTSNSVNNSQPASETTAFGFLNYRNARMVEEARRQFRGRWGNRPLVDNWRRTNAIGRTIGENQPAVPVASGSLLKTGEISSDEKLGIDLETIPVSTGARTEMRSQRARLQYQLGNLFFLTLNQPDSARHYFKLVLQDSLESSVEPQAMYSLYRLYELQAIADSSAEYREKILKAYPNSVYAARIQQQEGSTEIKPDSLTILREKVQMLLDDQASTEPRAARAEAFRTLAVEHKQSPLAPTIFYEGIKEYINVAKNTASAPQAPDSMPVQEKKMTAADSLNITAAYSGNEWDRVRQMLTEFLAMFPDADQVAKVHNWLEIMRAGSNIPPYTCDALGIEPEIQPDMQHFLRKIEMPVEVRNMKLSGTITYRLIIGKKGEVEAYERISGSTGLGIESAYERAIENELHFAPVLYRGNAVRISCEVTFPVTY